VVAHTHVAIDQTGDIGEEHGGRRRSQRTEDGGQKTEDEEATSSTGARASCPLCHASCRATLHPVGRCGLAAPTHLEEVLTAKAAFLRKET
jgi:hypothetical protein